MTAAGSPTQAEGLRRVFGADLDLRLREYRLPGTDAERARLRRSLERDGQQQPVVATTGIDPGALVLLDGFSRVSLLAEIPGGEPLLVRVVALDRVGSLTAMLMLNASVRGLTAIEEAWIIAALHREQGLTQVDVADRLGRHKSWVCRRLALTERLVRGVQDDVRLGLVTTSAARDLVRLPQGNQAPASRAVAQHQLTARQTTRLVDLLLLSPVPEHAALLADPLAHLDAVESARTPADPRLGPTGNQVRQALVRFHNAASRLADLLLSHPPGALPALEREVLSASLSTWLRRVREALELARQIAPPAEEHPVGS